MCTAPGHTENQCTAHFKNRSPVWCTNYFSRKAVTENNPSQAGEGCFPERYDWTQWVPEEATWCPARGARGQVWLWAAGWLLSHAQPGHLLLPTRGHDRLPHGTQPLWFETAAKQHADQAALNPFFSATSSSLVHL